MALPDCATCRDTGELPSGGLYPPLDCPDCTDDRDPTDDDWRVW